MTAPTTSAAVDTVVLLQVTDYTYGDAYCLGLMSRYTGVFPGLNTQLAVYQRAPKCATVRDLVSAGVAQNTSCSPDVSKNITGSTVAVQL